MLRPAEFWDGIYSYLLADVQSNTSLDAPVKGPHKCNSGPKSADLKKGQSHWVNHVIH